jgi:hypothetical protein
VVVLGQRCVGGEAAVDFDDGVEAVQLVRHGGCKDGLVGAPDDGCREVMVVFWVRDALEAHADWEMLVDMNRGQGESGMYLAGVRSTLAGPQA